MFAEKLVSVIMPVYNAEKYLRLAIESILKQTYRNFELIITDDGSTDRSLDIISEYAKKDDRIVIISRKNRGLVYTLNEAINIAKGEYIARMDADDVCHKSRLEKQVELLNEQTDIYIVGTNFNLIFEEDVSEQHRNTMINFCNVLNSYELKGHNAVQRYNLLHATWMVRKKLFDYIGQYKEYKATEDAEFLFRAMTQGFKISKIPISLYEYRIRTESKSNIDFIKGESKKDMIRFHMEYLDSLFGENLNHIRYLIWGASETGLLASEYLKDNYTGGRLVAYIDSMKKGLFNGTEVISYQDIEEKDIDYIFICTHSGAKFAQEYLRGMGYKEVKDYLVLI